MSYLHIPNLYQNQTVLLFREVYALEKIHGTSTHISYQDGKLDFYPGGLKEVERFRVLFDEDKLLTAFQALGHPTVVVFGEAYGGSCQKMSHMYGKAIKFIVFDVQVGDTWLNVPNAEDVAKKLGLEFVHYVKVPGTVDALNAERDADSVQAVRNGVGAGKPREGVVIRPLIELRTSNDERVIAKHKREEFGETKTPREVTPEAAKVLADAEAISLEWVTEMRLQHVLDKLQAGGVTLCAENTVAVIRAMTEDVEREAATEIVMSRDAKKAIGSRTAKMFLAWQRANLQAGGQ